MSYVHLIVHTTEQFEKDMLVARLSELDFDGFEEKDAELHAYVPIEHFQEKPVKDFLDSSQLSFASSIMAKQNWNALWESNFEPVTIDDFCTIRADFHPVDSAVEHDVVITPKMSFGTGHHATTYLMIQEMRSIEFKEKEVADFGTGTGILAILAEKLGSTRVWAIDHDDFSIENALENVERNNSLSVTVEKAAVFSSNDQFDVILANINKNVIIDNLVGLVFGLKRGGKLLLSGLLKEDEHDILMACQAHNVIRVRTVERDKWIAILLEH